MQDQKTSWTLDTKPRVSVVIPTANGAETIRSTIASVLKQTYDNIELICVDNASRDGTFEIEKEFCEPIKQTGGLSAQLNRGVTISTGKYILWIDQDFTLSPELVSECVELCERGEMNALVIPELRLGSSWMRSRQIEIDIYARVGDVGARFFTRDLFVSIGGMDETLSGMRDYDLGFRMEKQGGVIGAASAKLISYADDSLKDYVRKYYRRSATLKTIVERHGVREVYGPYLYFISHPGKMIRSYRPGMLVRFVLLKLAVGISSMLGILLAPDG